MPTSKNNSKPLTDEAKADYKKTVVVGIEEMLERDRQQGVLKMVEFIAVDKLSLSGILTCGRIRREKHNLCLQGDVIKVSFAVNGKRTEFNVVLDPDLDGFASCDAIGNFVLPKKTAA